MITVKCPHCQAGIRGEDRFAGRIVACPKCKKQVQMPAVAQPDTAKSLQADSTPAVVNSAPLIASEVVPEDVSLVIAQGGDNGKAELKTPSLRPCPDCGRMVSCRARQCPNCACPLDPIEGPIKVVAPIKRSLIEPTSIWKKPIPKSYFVGIILIASVLGIVIVVSANKQDSDKRDRDIQRYKESKAKSTEALRADIERLRFRVRELKDTKKELETDYRLGTLTPTGEKLRLVIDQRIFDTTTELSDKELELQGLLKPE